MGLFDRLKSSLQRTKEQLVQRFEEVVRQADTPEARTRPIDVDTLDALEEILIGADVGVGATAKIVEAVSKRKSRGFSPASTAPTATRRPRRRP
jgi:signal recognition particle GTPase